MGAGREHGVQLRIAKAGREANDTMPGYTYDLIRAGLAALGKDPGCAKSWSSALPSRTIRTTCGILRSGRSSPRCGPPREVVIYDPLVSDSAAGRVRAEPARWRQRSGAPIVSPSSPARRLRDLDLAALAGQVSMPCLIVEWAGLLLA